MSVEAANKYNPTRIAKQKLKEMQGESDYIETYYRKGYALVVFYDNQCTISEFGRVNWINNTEGKQ